MFLIDYFAYCMLYDLTVLDLYFIDVSGCLFAGGWILTIYATASLNRGL